jgi:outer membrane lipoprotein-sorting protein
MQISALILILSLVALPAPGAESLEKVLAAMDAAAAEFRSMTGRIDKTSFTKVLNDISEESGTIAIKRTGSRGMRLLVRITKPDPKAYAFEGRKVEIYYPKTNLIEEYDLGKHRQLLDQFLLLGFSTPSSELQASYSIQLGGEETVAGQRTARLELVPKSEKAREYLAKAEIWVSLSDGRTVRQKFHERSGDYRQVTFADAKWNLDLPDSALRLNPPKGVKRVQPQK